MSRNHPEVDHIREIYTRLYARFGPQHWWPADSDFEVIVGAVLTQNTNWKNVEKAIANLKSIDALSVERLHAMDQEELAQCIRPAGYFNVKAKRLKQVVAFIMERFGGSLSNMRRVPLEDLRSQLLAVNGVGPETADSILLYALQKKVFVCDAYTKRFMTRHNWAAPEADYHTVQDIFMSVLPADAPMFNEYHALIVKLCKEHCKTVPDCEGCPLADLDYNADHRCSGCYRSFGFDEKGIRRQKKNNTVYCRRCGDNGKAQKN